MEKNSKKLKITVRYEYRKECFTLPNCLLKAILPLNCFEFFRLPIPLSSSLVKEIANQHRIAGTKQVHYLRTVTYFFTHKNVTYSSRLIMRKQDLCGLVMPIFKI